MTEEEFQAEMKRRCEDTDPGIPWAEVKAQALKDIEEAAR
jgi:hypothetical protein